MVLLPVMILCYWLSSLGKTPFFSSFQVEIFNLSSENLQHRPPMCRRCTLQEVYFACAGRPSCASLQQQQQQRNSNSRDSNRSQQGSREVSTDDEDEEQQEAGGFWHRACRRRSVPMASVGDCMVAMAAQSPSAAGEKPDEGDPRRHQWPADSW